MVWLSSERGTKMDSTEAREINQDWKGKPQPNIMAELKRLHSEHGWPSGRCMRVATLMSRQWGIDNGWLA